METERLILRRWRESDAASLFRYACDPDVGPSAGWQTHTSVENSRHIIRTVFAAPEIYSVVLKETNEPIGCCGLVLQESPQTDASGRREAEVGYWIGKPYWGRGLIPEAVNVLLARGFRELHLDAVWCIYYDGNRKSKRVAEKCGFSYHHTNPDVATPLGDVRTEHACVITKEDYSQR